LDKNTATDWTDYADYLTTEFTEVFHR